MDTHLLHECVNNDASGKCNCKCCDMRLAPLSLMRENSSIFNILHLPVECLTKIFKYLAPNQLVPVSLVCRKFKTLAENVFELYHDPGPIQIKYRLAYDKISERRFFPGRFTSRSKVASCFDCFMRRRRQEKPDPIDDERKGFEFVYKSPYQMAFPSLVRRLTIPCPHVNGKGYEKAFQFIRANCNEKLISLSLSDHRDSIFGDEQKYDRRIYGEIAREQLKHLKHLRVKDVSFNYLYDELLQYTQNLITLNVIHNCEFDCRYNSEQLCSHFESTWTNYMYPKLESICVHTTDNRFDLMPMIERHPRLRNVACDSFTTIKNICQSGIQFNYVAFLFTHQGGYGYSVLQRLHNDIVEFGSSKRFEKFELRLVIQYTDIHRIETIPNLTGLHPGFAIIYDKNYNTRLPMIERLCFTNHTSLPNIKEFVQRIDKLFPNLKELRVNAHNAEFLTFRYVHGFKEYTRAVLYDPQAFQNLKQFHYENDENVELSWDDVVDINAVRSKRPNPSKITVYLDPEHFHRFNKNVVELQFIEIKPWIHGGCQMCVHSADRQM